MSVELVDATVLPGRGEAFSLVFRGAAGVPLDQRTYLVEHRTLGEFPLFLVPLGPTDDGAQEFEAVVNRLEGLRHELAVPRTDPHRPVQLRPATAGRSATGS